MVSSQVCHGVALGAVFKLQGFAVIDSVLDLLYCVLVLGVWFTTKALVLNLSSRRQTGLPLLEAELDR